MQESVDKSVGKIIHDILNERSEDFSWTCLTPTCYDDFDYEDENSATYEIVEEEPQSPTFETLSSIRILCDTIHNNLANSGTCDESYLNIELMDIENKLREINDNLNTLQNYNNQPQILTGDIILS